MDYVQILSSLPKEWRYVAVNGNKQPYMKNWQKEPLKRSQLIPQFEQGKAKAIGVLAGEESGGLLFVDHDGPSASNILVSWGLSFSTLPPSWTVTSGRVGRFQIIYKVPEKYWSKIKTKKFKSGVVGSDGSVEQVELRWNGCQSVVAGEHPTTGGYRWMEQRSPDDIPEIAEAPTALIEKMFNEVSKPFIVNNQTEKVRSLLQAIDPSRLDDYDDWIKIGMAAHSVGDHSLLHDWEALSEKNGKYKSGECQLKWDSFKSSGISIGTLQKFARADGWTPQFPNKITADTDETPLKLQRLEGHELLRFLRNQEDKIEYNDLLKRIELNREPLPNMEYFYLQLQKLGYKVSKELAIDCSYYIAFANKYDPVKEYLELLTAKDVEPYPIDRLASEFLRPDDINLPEPTIYDKMVKICLINAVRRIYIPGCKHDTATILTGNQGIRKSTFWQVLFGPFFSDSLGDVSNKDDLLMLHKCWGMEWSEIDHITTRRHAGILKAFLSRQVDTMRVPYGRTVEDFPRRSVMLGSSNKDTGLLMDDSGNRRFHIIPVLAKEINTSVLDRLRDKIWRAAIIAFENKEDYYFDKEDADLIENLNENLVESSPWQEAVEKWLEENQHRKVTIADILAEAIEKPLNQQSMKDKRAVGTILRSLKYTMKRTRVNGKLKDVWFPPEAG